MSFLGLGWALHRRIYPKVEIALASRSAGFSGVQTGQQDRTEPSKGSTPPPPPPHHHGGDELLAERGSDLGAHLVHRYLAALVLGLGAGRLRQSGALTAPASWRPGGPGRGDTGRPGYRAPCAPIDVL